MIYSKKQNDLPIPKKEVRFIYWFAYYHLDSPSVRYRAKYPLEYLKSNYHINSYFVIPGYSFYHIRVFLRAYFSALLFRKAGSLIVIQRIHSSFIYATLLKLLIRFRPSQTFYDLDDADYLEYPSKTIFHFIKHCSGVFVGSRELLNNLSKLNANVILNTSPVPELSINKSERNATLTIGWIGDFTGGHKESMMNCFFSALNDLPFKIRLILLGVGRRDQNDFIFLKEYFRPMEHIHLIMPSGIQWNDERAIQKHIREFDIGIATLLDNELCISKSAFKVKQCLNNGVPVLSSDLPENKFFIQDGRNGFLCSTPEEFRQRIIEISEMTNSEYIKLSAQAKLSTRDFNLATYCRTLLTGKGQTPGKALPARSNISELIEISI